jgi:hypothetical protein
MEEPDFCPMEEWSTYIVVASPPATEWTGAMGREIESLQGVGWLLYKRAGCSVESQLILVDNSSDPFFSFFFLKKGCPGWGVNPGPLDFIYFLIFTTLPLSPSGSPQFGSYILSYLPFRDAQTPAQGTVEDP